MAKYYFNDLSCTGSIFKDNNKDLWTFNGHYIDTQGKKQSLKLSAKKKKDLEAKVRFRLTEATGKDPAKQITLFELHQKYIEQISSTCRPRTIETYEERMKHVLDKFGSRNIHTISTKELEEYLNQIAKPIAGSAAAMAVQATTENLQIARSTVNATRGYLRRCFNQAVKDGYIRKNPVDDIEHLEEEDPETVALTQEQAQKLLEVAHSGNYIYAGIKSSKYLKPDLGTQYYIKQYYVLVLLLLSNGLRIGEALGLAWDKINFSANTMRIDQQLTRNHGRWYLSQFLKTDSSYRDISINSDLANLLIKFQEYQNDFANTLGDYYAHKNNLVFTNTYGGYVNEDSFRKKYFYKMCKEAGLPEEFVIHSCRHTTATLLVDAGANLRTIADTLGHKSTRTLLDIYAKATKRSKDEIAEIMGNQLKPKND